MSVVADASGPSLAAPAKLRQAAGTNSKLLSRSSLTFAARVVGKLSQLVFLIVAARLLSLDEFAGYSYLVGIALTFSLLGDTGVALAASREVAAARMTPAAAFSSGLPVVAVGALLTAAVAFGFGIAGSGPSSSLGLLLLVAGVVAANLMLNFCDTLLRGVGRFTAEAVLQITSAFGFLVLAVIAAVAGLGLWGILGALVVKEAVTGVAAYALLRPSLAELDHPLRGAWRKMLATGIRLGLASTALAVATRSELLVLGNAAHPSQVAYFSGPLRLADAALLFALTAGYALLPGVTFLAATDVARVRRLVWRVVGWMTAAGAVLGAIAALGAEPLSVGLFGQRFEPSTGPATVLMAGLPAYAALGVIWYALISFDAERLLLPMAALAALGSIAAGVLVIPPHGATGAAWVYVGTTVVMAVAGAALLHHHLRRLPVARASGADVSTRGEDVAAAAPTVDSISAP